MKRRFFAGAMLLGTTALVACGLDAVGNPASMDTLPSSADGGISDDDDDTPAPVEDAATPSPDAADTSSPPPTCTTTDTTCSDGLAAGWKPVALLASSEDSCPPDFTARDLFQGTAGADACDCVGTPAAEDPPSCEREPNYKVRLGLLVSDLGCTIERGPYDVGAGKCVPLKLDDSTRNGGRFPLIQHNGKCQLACTGNDAKVTKKAWRVCEPSAACTETACLGVNAPAEDASAEDASTPASLTYCLEHEGDVPCPNDDAGTFQPIVAGENLTISCTGGTCENEIKCGNGTVHVFGTDDCSGAELTSIPTNEQCIAVKDGAKTFKYTATPLSLASKIKTPATASVSYMGTKTICCKK